MATSPEQIKHYFKKVLWEDELSQLPPIRAKLVLALRIVYATLRDLTSGQVKLHAMGLVYTTLLSLVPLLALSFSVLKGFGVHNQIEPLLLNLLAPFGDKAIEISSRIINFVENVNVGVLGAVGLGLLLYTITSLLQKIERAFNSAWRVKRGRNLIKRFSEYLSVIMIGPVLVFSAIGVTAALVNAEFVQHIITQLALSNFLAFIGKLIPYVLITLAFTFVYIFIPNTKVHLLSAFYGALVAGFLWETMGWAFASFVASSAKYTAIYSSFAIMILFLIWLYLSWLILLIGNSIAFYHQHPEYLSAKWYQLTLSNRVKEKLALLIIALIGEHYYENKPAWSIEALSKRTRVPSEAIETIIDAMEQAGLLENTDSDPPRYLPARALESVTIKEFLDMIRSTEEDQSLELNLLRGQKNVDHYVARIEQGYSEALNGHTLRDIASRKSN